jgi:hypothetical protein
MVIRKSKQTTMSVSREYGGQKDDELCGHTVVVRNENQLEILLA